MRDPAEQLHGPHSPPLVSVVMIFKDAAPFLTEAADSVLTQTWPALELVLVDDGGSDGSDALAEEVRAADPLRVRVVGHGARANRGTGPSRVLGVQHAAGDLVAFLDADDVWGPDHLRHDVALLLGHPEADMVCGRSRVWRSWSGHGDDELNPVPFAPGVVVAPPRLLRAVLRNSALAIPTCSLLVRRPLLAALADELSGFRSTYEDQVINTMLHLRASAVMSGASDAWYRQHPGSLTAEAKRSGLDADTGRSPARHQFLTWLAARPELADEQVDRELVALVRAELAQQQGPARAWRSRVRAAVRQVPQPLRRVGRLLPRTTRTGHVDVHAAREAFLHRWGEDLHGSVMAVGSSAVRAAAAAGSRVERLRAMSLPQWRTTDGPTSPVDCLLLVPDEAALDGDLVSALAEVLPALLSPGGAVLVSAPSGLDVEDVRSALRGRLDEDCLDVRAQPLAGHRQRRMVSIRGVRRA